MSEYFMMDYWGLDNAEPTQKPLNADLGDEEIQWFMGHKIPVDLPEPIELQWNPEISGGGPAWEAFGKPSDGPRNEQGVRRQWAYPSKQPPLFHRDIIAELRECGIDNFDTYETKIVDTETGVISKDYLAVNFIGLVKAVDMEKSMAIKHSEDGLVDTDFDSVVLDEAVIRGLKLFRLAETVTALVVHRTVKEHLESKGGFELTFTQPEDWIG